MGRPASCHCGECRKCKHAATSRRSYRKVGHTPVNRAKRREYENRRYREDEEFRRRKLARNAVTNAIRSGALVPGPCALCGDDEVQGHHNDYWRPLEVVWLCVPCHLMIHDRLPSDERPV